jgi:hypothetical protein
MTNAYMTLNIRVCGAETLSLVDATKKFYINGVETGDPGAMSESTRYQSITQATFEAWFSLSPGGDPCVVDYFEVLERVNPDVAMRDSSVILTGSFGSHVLKIDRTVATNARSVYLRARTKGLVHIEQEIEFVTCNKTGSSIVTLPTSTS